MKKTIILMILFSGMVFADDFSARSGFTADNSNPAPESVSGTASEAFDDITTLAGDGWIQDNQSNPVGTTDWFQGNDTVFAAQAGAPTAYIGANFNNTAGSDICNYLILPDLGYLQSVTFWARTTLGNTFPDRLVVRHSPSGGTTTGDCFNGFGDFTDSLLEINPNLVTGGFPDDWAEQIVPVNGAGRVALIYWVANGGPAGSNSNYIGIDSMSWVAGTPPPPPVVPSMTVYGLILMAGLLMLLVRRKIKQ